MKPLMVQHLLDALLVHEDRARVVLVLPEGSEIDLTDEPRNVALVATTEPFTKDDGVVIQKPVLKVKVG